MRKLVFIIFFIVVSQDLFAQGLNHQWLIGYYSLSTIPKQKARLLFDTASYSFQTEVREMSFKDTQGNISDANGNFLMSSNGVWIANANGDIMMNGNDLNPNNFTSSWGGGLPIANGNIFLPFPGDSTKYVLFHQTGDSLNNVPSTELYYSVIDMTLDSGLGSVTSQKNVIIFQDTIVWGLAACRHANGRDWWIATVKDNTDTLYLMLFTPNGITSVTKQSLGFGYATPGNISQLTFSPNGDKLIYSYCVYFLNQFNVVISDFNRCNGMFSNNQVVQISNNSFVMGLAFSSSGNYAFASTPNYLSQININTLQVDTVATFDSFSSPFPPFYTLFDLMYLAANGKIYIVSGNSTSFLHYINYPDNAGIACDVQQHGLSIDSVRHFRSVPNHPNYYLGRLVGSPCDTLQWTGIEETEHDFRFRIYPNPMTSNSLHIGYQLPQNKAGVFSIYDVTGKMLFKYTLPQWSNEQQLNLPDLSGGVYSCVVSSSGFRVGKKLVVIK